MLEVLGAALGSITTHQHDLVIVNFANPDMVGHTGDLQQRSQQLKQ